MKSGSFSTKTNAERKRRTELCESSRRSRQLHKLPMLLKMMWHVLIFQLNATKYAEPTQDSAYHPQTMWNRKIYLHHRHTHTNRVTFELWLGNYWHSSF